MADASPGDTPHEEPGALAGGAAHGAGGDAPKAKGGRLTLVLIAVVALAVGIVVLTAIQQGIRLIWVEGVDTLPDAAMWAVVLGSTTLAGVLVATLRSHGQDGHTPLAGFATNPVYFRQYPSIIGAILISLFGGVALGPEVALVMTGALVGTEIGRWRGDVPVPKAAMLGILAAVLALFIGPRVTGTFEVAPNYTFRLIDAAGAVGIAVVTGLLLLASRAAAVGLVKLRGGDVPKLLPMTLIGLAIGLIAMLYHQFADEAVTLVLTSGEEQVKPLLALGSASAIGLAVAGKWLAYTLSMGGGFRGGPFFPALFIGAGVGGIAVALFPDLSTGAAAAGLTAGFGYLLRSTWKATVILGLIMGLYVGSWQAILVCLVAALVARAMPITGLGDKAAKPAAGSAGGGEGGSATPATA